MNYGNIDIGEMQGYVFLFDLINLCRDNYKSYKDSLLSATILKNIKYAQEAVLIAEHDTCLQ